jgi:hypothetical protein
MRSRFLVLSAAAVLGATLAGCSGAGPSGPALVVQGTVSQALATNDARAIAIGTDGRTFWTDLDAQRDFTLLLPVGQSYRIVIANAGASGPDQKIAHLVLQQSWGASLWLGANAAGSVDLGVLKLTSHGGSSGKGSSGHAGDDDDDHEGDHDHDNGCHEGGHHGGKDAGSGGPVCSGDDDEPLQPTKNPGSKCEDHDHHGHHQDGGKATGDDDDDDDHDGDDPPCPAGDGGSPAKDGGPKTDAGAPGSDAGSGGGVGAECLSSADCAAPLTCKAGLCSP